MARFWLRTILIFALLWFQPAAHANDKVKVGAPAPALTLKELLQAPVGVHGTWQELKGQAVVVEFWATWCGGCVDNIPHLNELAEKFKTRPIQFISITDETDIDLVKRFLARHPISGWVAFDDDASTFKRYGIGGRPQTLLISQSGVLEALTSPTSVTPQVLEDLIAGKPLNFPEIPLWPPIGLEPGAAPPLVQVLIRPAAPDAVSRTGPGGVIDKNGRYDAYGMTLRRILSDAYEIPEKRVEAPAWCSETRYDLSVVTPQHEEALRWPLVKQTLDAAFQLKLHEETKETSVYVLKKMDGQQPKLRPATTAKRAGYWNHVGGEAQMTGVSVETIAAIAASELHEEIFNETGLTGRYDFDLQWDAKEPTTLAAAFRDQLGLQLAIEPRKLAHLVVDSVIEPMTW